MAKFYGSANDEANLITELYGRGDMIAAIVGTIDPENPDPFITAFDDDKFYAYLKNNYKPLLYTSSSVAQIAITCVNSYYCVTFNNGGNATILIGNNVVSPTATVADLDNLGITVTAPLSTSASGYINLSLTIDGRAQKTLRLYGSANGQAKLIHQGFGHHDYGYGEVTYYSNSGHTTTAIGTLRTQEEVDSLSWTSPTATNKATIDGVEVERPEIKEVKLFSKVLSIPQFFSAHCSNLEKCDISNTGITAIPRGFLSNASTLNSEIILPSTVISIGDGFMLSCLSFNQNLTLPTNLTSIGANFLSTMRDMISEVDVGSLSADIITYSDLSFMAQGTNAPSYTTGIKIAGANRSAWIAKFPNESDPYARKLVNAGH